MYGDDNDYASFIFFFFQSFGFISFASNCSRPILSTPQCPYKNSKSNPRVIRVHICNGINYKNKGGKRYRAGLSRVYITSYRKKEKKQTKQHRVAKTYVFSRLTKTRAYADYGDGVKNNNEHVSRFRLFCRPLLCIVHVCV